MDEAHAWLQQAFSDRSAAERFVGADGTQWCHAVAKHQQTVEKAVKAIVAALGWNIGYTHEIANHMTRLIHMPRAGGKKKDVAGHVSRLLDESTRTSIHALEDLIPRRPPPRQPHRKNTEYPFQNARNEWNFPANQGVFTSADIQRFRTLSYRIADGASRIIKVIQRAPR